MRGKSDLRVSNEELICTSIKKKKHTSDWAGEWAC